MRLLLLHVKGATCFEDIRTFKGTEYSTFKECCIARGFLEDDIEWNRTLNEASEISSPHQIRNLFVTILIHGEPSNPPKLWESFKHSMSEDIFAKCKHLHSDLKDDEKETFEQDIYNKALLNCLSIVISKSCIRTFWIKNTSTIRSLSRNV